MVNKSIWVLLFVAVVFGIIFWYSGGSRVKDEVPYYLKDIVKETSTVTIHDRTYKLEIAKTPDARAKGLSGRSYLGQDKGMLFAFPTADTYAFTMANTLISLDIIWINNDTVVFIANRAQPHQVDIIPTAAANYVVELNGGQVESAGIKVGDKVSFTFDGEIHPE